MIVTRALNLVPRAVNRQTVAKMSDVNYKGAVSDSGHAVQQYCDFDVVFFSFS